MSQRLENVSLTVEAGEKAKRLRDEFGLAELSDIIRLAVSVALRENLSLDTPAGTTYGGSVNFRTDAIDPEGNLRMLIQRVYSGQIGEIVPSEDVALRVLMTKGVEFIHERHADGEWHSLADVLAAPSATEPDSAGQAPVATS